MLQLGRKGTIKGGLYDLFNGRKTIFSWGTSSPNFALIELILIIQKCNIHKLKKYLSSPIKNSDNYKCLLPVDANES